MSPFGDKIEVSVATTVTRVIEDKLVPDAVKTGAIKGLFDDNDQFIENIMEELTNSVGIKAERMYAYAKKDYWFGLPTQHIISNTDGNTTVKSVLEELEGHAVTVEYCHYGPLNSLHYGWQTLCDTYGYIPFTNEIGALSTLKGASVYLKDMQVVVVEASLEELTNGALDQWGTAASAGFTPDTPIHSVKAVEGVIAPTPFAVDPEATQDYFKVTYIWVDPVTKKTKTEEARFPMPFIEPGLQKRYYQAKYTYGVLTDHNGVQTTTTTYPPEQYQDSSQLLNYLAQAVTTTTTYADKHVKYFTYEEGEGTWPELDTIYVNDYNDLGSFFPFAYFRLNSTSTTGNPNSPGYKSQKKLLKYLNMKYKDVADAINSNPDIKDVDSALMMMAVPANTTTPIEQRYLYEFFKSVYIKSGAINTVKSRDAHVATTYEVSPMLRDTYTSITPLPSPETEITIKDKQFTMALRYTGIYRHIKQGNIGTTEKPAKKGEYNSGSDEQIQLFPYTNASDLTPTTYYWERVIPYHYYRKQLSANTYEEIQVWELQMKYYVLDSLCVSANTLMVPLDHSITDKYTISEKETMYSRSLHYVFNAKFETAIKWYQRAWFRTILYIVAIILTVLDWGSDGGAWLALVVAITTYTLTQLIMFLLIRILLVIAVQLVAKLFVKLFGPEFAILVAVVAACVAIYSPGSTGFMKMPYASTMLQVSSGIIKESGVYYTEAIKGIAEDADEFKLYAKGERDKLEEANKLLEHDNFLSPFVIWGESPDDFFNRTVHSGNIGIMSIDNVSSYVDISLTLPKINSSVGEDFNV